MTRPNDRKVADLVLADVAQVFDLAPALLRRATHEHAICRPRQIAFWLLRRKRWSLQRIGRAVGAYHHTTVLNGLRRVEQQRREDGEYRALTDSLAESVDRVEGARMVPHGHQPGRIDVIESRLAVLESELARMAAG